MSLHISLPLLAKIAPCFFFNQCSFLFSHSFTLPSPSLSLSLPVTFPLCLSLSLSLSPGVLFLQFGDETRRVHITHELTSMETLHALIVHMFPQKLTAGMLKSPNTAILIKDEARNVFYELEDVRDIQDRSIIKIYRKEPIYASYPASHLANGDLRVSWSGGSGGWGMEVGGWTMYFKKRGLRICVYMKWTDKVLGGRFGLLYNEGNRTRPLILYWRGKF